MTTRPSARVADLARRLDDLGVLESWDAGIGADAVYLDADWNPERTRAGHLHVNMFRGRRAVNAVRDAVDAGATALCWQAAPQPLPLELAALLRSHGVALLRVVDERRAYSLAGALLFGFPADRLHSVGITGTNAKTTTAVMLAACLQRSGVSHALSTSVVMAAGDELLPPGLTTPDAPQLHELLASALDNGATHAVIEASSQGLAHQRLADVDFSVGVCTTIGLDHLNVHGSEAAYRQAKRMLFEGLSPDGFAIYNADEPAVAEVAAEAGAFDVPVGHGADALARRHDAGVTIPPRLAERCGRSPADIRIDSPNIDGHERTSAALAATAAYVLGVDVSDIEAGLGDFVGLPRRLSVVTRRPFVLVDDMFNAHSAATVGPALRPLRKGTSRFLCGISVRGNRGVETNMQQGQRLGRALVNLDVDEVHVTRSAEVLGPADLATDDEQRAMVDALNSWGLDVVEHVQLDTLLDAILNVVRPRDLVAFFGHPGMEAAVGQVQQRLRSSGRQGRRNAERFVDADIQIRRSIGRAPGQRTGNAR